MDNLKLILSDIFKVRPEQITDQSTMKDIAGWDSLGHMDLIVALEQHYNIRLSGDEIADMRSVEAIKVILEKYNK